MIDKTYKPPENYQVKYEPKKNEVLFYVVPIGVKYFCEFCTVGEMKILPVTMVPKGEFDVPMFNHKCTKCNGELLLPKQYPYIEWEPVTDIGCPF